MTARMGQLVYVDANDPRYAFVRLPHVSTLYIRTHLSVVRVQCPHCNAGIGEPCVDVRGSYIAQTHVGRRRAYADQKKKADAGPTHSAEVSRSPKRTRMSKGGRGRHG